MKKLFLSFILFSTLTFSQDAIEVSPSTLDFGNVLMGNTPSLTFTINCNLDQIQGYTFSLTFYCLTKPTKSELSLLTPILVLPLFLLIISKKTGYELFEHSVLLELLRFLTFI